jgi:hypothetical protein
MRKSIREMTVDEVITAHLQECGLDPNDKELRAKYDIELVKRVKAGDNRALIEFLKIGTHHGPVISNTDV